MKISEHLLDYALLLVLFPFFCFVLGSLGFLVGLPLTKWHAVTALALTLGVLKLQKKTWRDWSFAALIFLGLQLGCMLVGALHTDNSCDGRLYHKPAAILMADGWNPVWEPDVTPFCERNGINSQSFRVSLTSFFPKGQWIVCAIFYLATGNIDQGDYVCFMLLFVATTVFYYALREWLGTENWLALLAALVMALNPICVTNLMNGHVDGILADFLLIFLLACACFLKNGGKQWIPWILISAIYGCSLKHTAPVYFGCVGFVLTLPILWQKFFGKKASEGNSLSRWLKIMLPIPVLVAIFCANPYITNTVAHTSPFYPLHSFDRVNHPVEDVLGACFVMEGFGEANNLQRFVYSYLFGQPLECETVKKLDYRIDQIGTIAFRSNFVSLNALGWIFGLALVFAFFLLFFIPLRGNVLWPLLALIVTILIQPHAWWARYVPQIWGIPILVFLISVSCWKEQGLPVTRLKFVISVLLLGLFLQGLWGFTYTNLRILAFLQLDKEIEKITQANGSVLVMMGTLEKENPSEIQLYPAFNFYLARQAHDQRLPNVTVFQSHHGWQAIPGKPLAYYDGLLLCSAKEPVGTYDFDEVELDKKDVSLCKIPSSILWRLNQRLHQFY